MSKKLFGTDGVRGTVGVFPVIPDFLVRLGMSIGGQLVEDISRSSPAARPCVLLGKDTRFSADMVVCALTSGLLSAGVDVRCVGVLPTPALAMLPRLSGADWGLVVSASHNPFQDSGVKIFDHQGEKLSEDIEAQIERRLEGAIPVVSPQNWGRLYHGIDSGDASDLYVEFVKSTFPQGMTLRGVRLVVDCAHGANGRVGIRVFEELGAAVIPVGVASDGFNINQDCGALQPETMQRTLAHHKAHIGIAFDGDGDRLILADDKGRVIDGDQILALLASAWQASGKLRGHAVVGTMMSNLGLEHFLDQQGLSLIRAQVGDRHVAGAMRQNGCNVGGEQSGHILLSDYHTAGDALIAALQVLAVLVERQVSASSIFPLFTPVPQILRSVRVPCTEALAQEKVHVFLEKISRHLGNAGRLVVRASGTEPVTRVMIEGNDQQAIETLADEILDFLYQCCPAA